MKIKISFDVVYGADKVSEIRYAFFGKYSGNRQEYIDNTGSSTSHVLDLDHPIVPDPSINGDIVGARIDIKDVEGNTTVFYASQFVQGYTPKPALRNLEIYQRNDGSGIVDINYIYDGLSEINNSYLYVQFSIDKGVNWSQVPTTSLKGDFGFNVLPGNRRVTWLPAVDLADLTVSNPILCRLTLYDTDSTVNAGDSITGVLVYDIIKPSIAIRRLTPEEEAEFWISSSSSTSSMSSSSSSIDSSSSSSNSQSSESSSSSSS